MEFQEFLDQVEPEYRQFVRQTHEALVEEGYKFKAEAKASGPFLSYAQPKTRRSLLNLFFRKNGLHARIYANHHGGYAELIDALPEEMERQIAKATTCKQLAHPGQSHTKCAMGYDVVVGGNRYQKCRYACFQFSVDQQSAPVLAELLRRECEERRRT